MVLNHFLNAENQIIEEIDFALKYSYSETFCLSFFATTMLISCKYVLVGRSSFKTK